MKKILFWSFTSRMNLLGCPKVTPYCSDVLSLKDFYKAAGYEIYYNNPYRCPHKIKDIPKDDYFLSNQEAIKMISQFDFVVSRIDRTCFAGLIGRSRFSQKVLPDQIELAEAIKNSNITVFNHCVDYRTSHLPFFPDRLGKTIPQQDAFGILCRLVNSSNWYTLIASKSIPQGLSSNRLAFANFDDYYYCNKEQTLPSDTFKYDYIYGGNAAVRGHRQEVLQKLTINLERRATVGQSSVGLRKNKWPSLSNFKAIKFSEFEKIIGLSKVQIVVGEPWHDFLSARFYEALYGPSIFVVHSSYQRAAEKASSIGLAHRIVS